MEVDPICGAEIKERDPERATEFQGKIFYFCSVACRQKFNQERGILEERLAHAKKE